MILVNAFIITFVVWFVKATTWDGMVFDKPYDWLEARIPEKLFKPILGCPVCMTPWWGTAIYLLANHFHITGFEGVRIQQIILTVFVAAGISTIFLMYNKEYDVAKKEDKILEQEVEKKGL